MNGNFLLAVRLALRLRPGAAAAVILLALAFGVICAGQVRSRKVRRTFLWALPLGPGRKLGPGGGSLRRHRGTLLAGLRPEDPFPAGEIAETLAK